MRILSLIFGVLTLIFMAYGIYLIINITEETEKIVFFVLLAGFILSTLFLVTDIIASSERNK